jgi:hypothetical protein
MLGNLAGIALAAGVSRQAVHKFIRSDPGLSALLDAERERVLDLVEHSLVQRAMAGEAWAVCFYLKTQGKRRGYVERQELTGAEGGPVRVRVAEELVDAGGDHGADAAHPAPDGLPPE